MPSASIATPLSTHRTDLLAHLGAAPSFDLAVVGGGATGLGVALDAAATHTLAQQLHYESERQRELVGGPAFNEGVQAFAAKRPPAFPGRD